MLYTTLRTRGRRLAGLAAAIVAAPLLLGCAIAAADGGNLLRTLRMVTDALADGLGISATWTLAVATPLYGLLGRLGGPRALHAVAAGTLAPALGPALVDAIAPFYAPLLWVCGGVAGAVYWLIARDDRAPEQPIGAPRGSSRARRHSAPE